MIRVQAPKVIALLRVQRRELARSAGPIHEDAMPCAYPKREGAYHSEW